MPELIADRLLYCGLAKVVSLLHPFIGYPSISNEDFHSLDVQGFSWHPDGILFDCENGFLWLRAYKSKEVTVQTNTETAIVVPIKIPEEGYICAIDDEGREDDKLVLAPGEYKMLFELRDMTDDEPVAKKYAETIYPDALEPEFSIRPEVCTLTFVAVKERVEPELLRFQPIVPYEYRKQVRDGSMKIEDFMPDEFIMFDTSLKR